MFQYGSHTDFSRGLQGVLHLHATTSAPRRPHTTYMQPLVRRGGSAIQPTCNQLCAAAAAPHNLHATTCAPRRRCHTTYMHPLVRRGGGATCTYPCVSKPFICACTNNLTGICNGNAEDA